MARGSRPPWGGVTERHIMNPTCLDRRQFLRTTTAAGGLAVLGAPLAAPARAPAEKPTKQTATDWLPLGDSGLKICRLGMGTGSRGGSVQRKLGKETFIKLLRYAYDQGVRYIDTADSYKIQPWIGAGIKGLPREKIYIQSKIWGAPDDPKAHLDRFRKELGVDYIDSVLVHCARKKDWLEGRKKVIDVLREAKAKKVIGAAGVSCHTLAALEQVADQDWVDVALVRINPQGVTMDTPGEKGGRSNASHVPAVVKQIKRMREKRIGIIGMKLIGNGTFTKADDREKAIRYTMQSGLLSAATIGFKSPAEIDEAMKRINAALAAAPAG